MTGFTVKGAHNTPTRYEIIATLPNGEKVRLGFLTHVNKQTLLKMAQDQNEKFIEHLPEEFDMAYKAQAWTFGNVTVGKSGMTEKTLRTLEGEA